MSREERELIESVDRVIVHSPGLMETKGGLNPVTVQIPNGVDFAAHAAAHPEPADMAGIPTPRIGYCGYIKPQLDWPLLHSLVERLEDYSFVFAGAPSGGFRESDSSCQADLSTIERMDARPNVWFLGDKTSAQLSKYPQHFDVCLLPYRLNEYTNCIYPMKIHEYLATGRPVVSTPIRSVLDFTSVVRTASSLEEWQDAVEASLTPEEQSEESRRKRREVARAHDWWLLVDRIAGEIASALGIAPIRP